MKKNIFSVALIICIATILSAKNTTGRQNYPELYFDTITLASELEAEEKGKLTDLTPVSKEFGRIFDKADTAFTSGYITRLSRYKIILIPGLFGDIYPKKRSFLSLDWQLGKYFHNQQIWLQANNIEYEILNLDTRNFAVKNIQKITNAIEQSKKPVIIMTHGKGGLETLDVLLSSPKLIQKVKGLIALQVPFRGTPLADYWLKKAYLMTPTLWYFKIKGTSRQIIENLTTDKRLKFNSKYKNELKKITKTIPFICIATWKPDNPYKADSGLWFTRSFLFKLGFMRNDGYIPLNYALIDGCEYVFIKNVDHRETVFPTRHESIDRVKLTKTLFLMLLNRI